MKLFQSLSISAGLVLLTLLSGCTPDAPPAPTEVETPSPTPTPDAEVEAETPSPSPTPSPAAQAPATTPVTPAPSPATPQPTSAPQPADTSANINILRCETTMVRVNDPTAPLNVRSQPQVAEGNIVGQLDDGTWVMVEDEQDGWWKISDPETGWISKNLTDSGCNQMVARVEFPTNATSVILEDILIGTGSHQYRLDALGGQTMSLTALNGPLPFVRAPSGEDITDGAGMQGETTWSGELPIAGDYVLEYPSNFQGYDYRTQVEIR